ncbi:MAG: hypothetical protein MUD14_19730 [Hydrococcus sp. Prado102]|jgi:hypothetical protein|nr:hypothetical protein [Hydrococcus sp. Prado102]
MTTIQINNLSPAGSELFSDSESYLKELSENISNIQGGLIDNTLYITQYIPWGTPSLCSRPPFIPFRNSGLKDFN